MLQIKKCHPLGWCIKSSWLGKFFFFLCVQIFLCASFQLVPGTLGPGLVLKVGISDTNAHTIPKLPEEEYDNCSDVSPLACKSAWQVRNRECANGRCAVLRSSPILAVPAPGGCGGRMGGGGKELPLQFRFLMKRCTLKRLTLRWEGRLKLRIKKAAPAPQHFRYTLYWTVYTDNYNVLYTGALWRIPT